VDDASRERNDEQIAREGESVKAMVSSIGWSEVIRPNLELWKEALINQFKDSLTYEQLVAIQKQIAAIDMLFGLVQDAKDSGKEARERLESGS
jgi:hypothetical protein